MSTYGPPTSAPLFSTGSASPNGGTQYGRGDLQAAFNWLVHQPDHVRKQASDPDRLMTLYYRSSGRNEPPRIENEAPVSGQNFLSDLRQINEAMRQFDGPSGSSVSSASFPQSNAQSNAQLSQPQQTSQQSTSQPQPAQHVPHVQSQALPQSQAQHQPYVHLQQPLNARTQAIVMEVREKLGLSNEAEALNALVSLGYRSLKPLIG